VHIYGHNRADDDGGDQWNISNNIIIYDVYIIIYDTKYIDDDELYTHYDIIISSCPRPVNYSTPCSLLL